MVWNYLPENVRYCGQVIKYNMLRYLPSTQVANYSDSTALDETLS